MKKINRPIRILHVVSSLKPGGGVQTWLLQVVRRHNRDLFKIDIFTSAGDGFYNNQFKALGVQVIQCPRPSRPFAYARKFLEILKKKGPYDVVQSHLFRYSGIVMRLAALAGVPLRIVHSRTIFDDRRLTFWRHVYHSKFFHKLMTLWLNKHSTHLLAVSLDAAVALLGFKCLNDYRLHIIPSGIDLVPFQTQVNANALKHSLGLPRQGKIVGHVGRFGEAKNHFFLLEIFKRLSQKDPHLWFLLVGDGLIRPEVEAKARKLGLINQIIFAGNREDVPNLMKGCMDLMLFPSKWEGTPRVVIEAQAAGVPCLISNVIPNDVDLVKPLVNRLSLSHPPEVWADMALKILQSSPPVSQEEALRILKESPFNIENNVRELENLYLAGYERIKNGVA